MTISNLIVGATYYFAATAYDSANLESDYSNEAIYTNVVLAPPTIVLSLPANGATFTAPATFSLFSRVTANGHTVSSVQFYNGTTLIGEDTNAPYILGGAAFLEGAYSLTARLIYDAGATLDSSPAVNVLVAAQAAEHSSHHYRDRRPNDQPGHRHAVHSVHRRGRRNRRLESHRLCHLGRPDFSSHE